MQRAGGPSAYTVRASQDSTAEGDEFASCAAHLQSGSLYIGTAGGRLLQLSARDGETVTEVQVGGIRCADEGPSRGRPQDYGISDVLGSEWVAGREVVLFGARRCGNATLVCWVDCPFFPCTQIGETSGEDVEGISALCVVSGGMTLAAGTTDGSGEAGEGDAM